MGKRTYTDADREAVRVALALHGNDANRAAKETGIPRTTILTWRDKPPVEGVAALPVEVVEAAVEQIRHEKKGEVVAAAWDLARAALARSQEALPEASAKDAATVAGIAIDKAQLLGGDATSRVDIRQLLAVLPTGLAAEVGRLLSTTSDGG